MYSKICVKHGILKSGPNEERMNWDGIDVYVFKKWAVVVIPTKID